MDGLVAVSDRLCRRVGAAPSRQRLAKTGGRAGRGSLWFPCSGQDIGSRLDGRIWAVVKPGEKTVSC